MRTLVLLAFLLMALFLLTGCANDTDPAYYGRIPRPAIEQSIALFGEKNGGHARFIELADDTCGVDVTRSGQPRTVIAQSFAGAEWRELTNPEIKNENPPDYRCRNVTTDDLRMSAMVGGFSTSAGPAFFGFLAGMTVFACADFGVGMVRSLGQPAINAGTKAAAFKVSKTAGTELFTDTMKTGGLVTLKEVEALESKQLISREAATLMRGEIREGRPVRFVSDAPEAWNYIRPALESADEITAVGAGGQIYRASRPGGKGLVQTVQEASGPTRLGTVEFQQGLRLNMYYLPEARLAQLGKPGGSGVSDLIRSWESAATGSQEAAKRASGAQQLLRNLYSDMGWCGIQVDHTIDAVTYSARGAYEDAAANSVAWGRFMKTRSASDWQAWVQTPEHASATEAVGAVVKKVAQNDKPQVRTAVTEAVEAVESSPVPTIQEVVITPRNAAPELPKPAAAAEPLALPPGPKTEVPLLAMPRVPLLTAGDATLVQIPARDVTRAIAETQFVVR